MSKFLKQNFFNVQSEAKFNEIIMYMVNHSKVLSKFDREVETFEEDILYVLGETKNELLFPHSEINLSIMVNIIDVDFTFYGQFEDAIKLMSYFDFDNLKDFLTLSKFLFPYKNSVTDEEIYYSITGKTIDYMSKDYFNSFDKDQVLEFTLRSSILSLESNLRLDLKSIIRCETKTETFIANKCMFLMTRELTSESNLNELFSFACSFDNDMALFFLSRGSDIKINQANNFNSAFLCCNVQICELILPNLRREISEGQDLSLSKVILFNGENKITSSLYRLFHNNNCKLEMVKFVLKHNLTNIIEQTHFIQNENTNIEICDLLFESIKGTTKSKTIYNEKFESAIIQKDTKMIKYLYNLNYGVSTDDFLFFLIKKKNYGSVRNFFILYPDINVDRLLKYFCSIKDKISIRLFCGFFKIDDEVLKICIGFFIQSKNLEILLILFEKVSKELRNIMFANAITNNIEIANILAITGADISSIGQDLKNNFFYNACTIEDLDSMRFWMENGADIHHEDNKSFKFASLNSFEEVILLMRYNGLTISSY